MAWYSSGSNRWKYRYRVIVDKTKVGADAAGFPTILKATTSEIALLSRARGSGQDFLVTLSDGVTKIAHELKYWDGTTLILFLLQDADVDADQDFYLYWGCATCDDQQDQAGTWPSAFEMVQHLPYLFAPDAGNPILAPEGNEDATAFASVLFYSGVYHMYYHYQDADDKYIVGHATSSDGKTWTKDAANNPVLDHGGVGTWDAYGAGITPVVWVEGGTWYMLYTGTNGTLFQGGLATSSDGVAWTKSGSNPVLPVGGAGAWDQYQVEPTGIIKVGSTYYCFISQVSAASRQVGVATSTNLTTWTKDGANPIFTTPRFCPCVFKDGSYYYLALPLYTSGTDYTLFELYRDTSPTFYSGSREFIGAFKVPAASGWDSHDQDVPWALTDDVTQDSFAISGDALWVYFSGEASGVWKAGLLIAPSRLLALRGSMRDSTSHAHHGTASGVGGPVSVNIALGGECQFDGTSQFIAVPDSAGLSFGNGTTDSAFTISFRAKFNSAALASRGLISKFRDVATVAREWVIYTNSGGKLFVELYDQSSGGYIGRGFNTALANDNAWHHYVVTYSGGKTSAGVKIFRDAVQIDDVDSQGGSYTAMENTAQGVEIGKYTDTVGDRCFAGVMTEVQIISAEMPATWVTTLFNSQTKPLVGESGGFWKASGNEEKNITPYAIVCGGRG